jgi:hypothetical protein
VDEDPYSDLDYLRLTSSITDATDYIDYFGLDGTIIDSMPSGAEISSVSIFSRNYANDTVYSYYTRIFDGTNTLEGSLHRNASYTVNEDAYATQADGSTGWTLDALKTHYFGIRGRRDGTGLGIHQIRCSQFYVVVTYTAPGGSGEPRLGHSIAAFDKHKRAGLAHGALFEGADVPEWWDTDYYRRARLNFGSSHSAIAIGDTVSFEMPTGYEIKIASNAVANEGVIFDGRYMIDLPKSKSGFDADYTYMLWTGPDPSGGNLHAYLARLNHSTMAISDAQDLFDLGTSYDTHNHGIMMIDADLNLHLILAKHNAEFVHYVSDAAVPDDTTSTIAISSAQTFGNSSTEKLTYPVMIEDNSGNIFCFCRIIDGSSNSYYGFYKLYYDSGSWTNDGAEKVCYYSVAESISGEPVTYLSGLTYDESAGRLHMGMIYWDGYGSYNKGRAITYLYSDDIEGAWYLADGTEVANTTTSTYCTYADIDQVWSPDASFPTVGPFYLGTGVSGISVDGDGRPYLQTAIWNTDIGEETDLLFAHWNGSSWDKLNLSTDVTGGKKLWRYRQGGVQYSHDSVITIYGFFKPASAGDYFAAEKFRYTSADHGATWTVEILSGDTGYGCGMMCGLMKQPTGRKKSLFYSRAHDMFYWEDHAFASILPNGADVRVVHQTISGGTTTSTELDRLPDRFSAEDTRIYFKMPCTVDPDQPYPGYLDNIYVYYSYPNATKPSYDPDDVWDDYDNFELYTLDSDLNSQGGWTCSPSDWASITDYVALNTNKVYSGAQVITSAQAGYASKTASISNKVLSVHGWHEFAGTSTDFTYIELNNGASWIRLGMTADVFAYERSSDGGTPVTTSTKAMRNNYHHFKVIINSSGVSFYGDDQTILSDDTTITSATSVRLGTTGSDVKFFDEFMVWNYIAEEPTITLDTSEGSVNIPESYPRLAEATGTLDKNISSRFAAQIALAKAAHTRMSGRSVGEKIDIERLAALVLGDKYLSDREGHGTSLDANKSERAAERLILITLASARAAHELLSDKEAQIRVGEYLDPDKHDKFRIAHALAADKTLSTRLAELLAADKHLIDRLAEITGLDKHMSYRLALLALAEKHDLERLAQRLNLMYFRLVRLAHEMLTEKLVGAHLAHTVALVPGGLAMVAHIVLMSARAEDRLGLAAYLDKFAHQRLGATLGLESAARDRQAHWAPLLAHADFRVSELAQGLKYGSARIGELAQAIKFNSTRLAELADVSKKFSIRVAELTDLEAVGLARAAMLPQLEAAATTRLGGMSALSGGLFVRLANTVLAIGTGNPRVAHALGLEHLDHLRLANMAMFIVDVQRRVSHMMGLALSALQRQAMISVFEANKIIRLSNKISLTLTSSGFSLSFKDADLQTMGFELADLTTLSMLYPELGVLSVKDADLTTLRIADQDLGTLNIKDASI